MAHPLLNVAKSMNMELMKECAYHNCVDRVLKTSSLTTLEKHKMPFDTINNHSLRVENLKEKARNPLSI